MASSDNVGLGQLALLLLLMTLSGSSSLALFDEGSGRTSHYMRRLSAGIDLPYTDPLVEAPPGENAPQQVHITQGDILGKAVIVSWITDQPSAPKVWYGIKQGDYHWVKEGRTSQYSFYNYTSGFIHRVTLDSLQYNTKYYYKIGEVTVREFWFTTPPGIGPDIAYTFGLIGDLGQSYDSVTTLEHYAQSSGKCLLYVGDLSYADNYPFYYQVRWDTWSRLIESSAAYQPWIWTSGNHEIEFLPEVGETKIFKSFKARFPTPYKASNSTSQLWYSIKRGSAHIIVLASYSSYGIFSPQWTWLQTELSTVDRNVTPWLLVLLHCPWYNSNAASYMAGESMRVVFEQMVVTSQVDVVFAGHVHAYERTFPVSNILYNITNGLCIPELNPAAPTYIVIGDGGNNEGPSSTFTEPQPNYSAYREASFGHGLFDIKNRTHAIWTWHRNQDGEPVVADSVILYNKVWYA
ncbi:hypothetical protein BDL97_04G044600 [Sphagnum fallax]|nr:hypothetical protein BDL97_04G044600 [Sphagnum fallax]KAH8964066.1 hypothetical protein BDL97_04G044600 [Sphagnum fallax]KAH8964067.1 hypothetical protein BDL97_04G044600 [Sphagnum fallax]KAH8964068.1 hypothetical protein BDL97_04G044600 [Sphagnum fallax]